MRTPPDIETSSRGDPSDSSLMARAGEGDRQALGILVRRHQGLVLSIAFRFLGDRSEAEDAAQEVFLRLWKAARRYRPEASLGAYLRRLTVNLCLDWKRKARPMILSGETGGWQGPADPHGDLEGAERRGALARELRTLPAPQRMAVVLFHYEGCTVAEAARLLECSPKALESLLSRARASLRERLARPLGRSVSPVGRAPDPPR